MSSPTEPGVTGRKARGASEQAPAAPAAAGAPAVPAAEAGTADQAAQAASAPVVIGAAEVPVEPGGPGAGAARIAETAEAVVSRPLDAAAEVALGLRPLSTGERAELEALRRLHGGATAATVVDAAQVPGRRLAEAATRILQDGTAYGPGTGRPLVPVTAEGYAELVSIGAIVARPWPELTIHPEG